MTIDPNKYQEYLAYRNNYLYRELDIPDFCFRKWPCQEEINAAKGDACFMAIPFKEIFVQLDQKTKDKMGVMPTLDCPQPYVDLLNRCLYGRQSEREGCPTKMVNPYR